MKGSPRWAHFGLGGAVLANVAFPRAADAQPTKTLIDYFEPAPIMCPLTSNTWGAQAVLPRDTCNGMEDARNPPEYLYWDGKIIRASDGKYHLFASRWNDSPSGHNGWFGSDAIHAVSDSSPLGPYADKGYAYDDGPDSQDSHKGHNVSACELLDGTYCLYVSEIVPFTIFTSSSLDGPWTNKGHAQISTNGVPAGSDGHLESNVSLVARPDGNFEIVQRHGLIALSTTGILGPYNVQEPTNTYPASDQPPSSIASIYPNRQHHLDPQAPATVESTYTLAEDPVIWYSGGQYHVVYDYPDDRIGYHLTSPDGIHDWTDQGLAYDPRDADRLFGYTDGTDDRWYKMERPGVLIEHGHVTHFTFAVTDVDKGQITANSNHGNKVIVVPFDGVLFDHETGDGGLTDGGGGAMGGGAADAARVGDATSIGGGGFSGGGFSGGGFGASGAAEAAGGAVATAAGGATTGGASGRQTTADASVSVAAGGGMVTPRSGGTDNGGCACVVAAGATAAPPAGGLAVALGAWLSLLRRRRRDA